MSLNDFLDPDDDDHIPDFDQPKSVTYGESAAQVLPQLALEAVLTRKTARLLGQFPAIVVIKVPHAAWSSLIVGVLRRLDTPPCVCVAVEKQKRQGALQRIGEDNLRFISDGRSVVYISQDPDEIIDEAVLAAADTTIVVPPLTPSLLRRLIRKVTGGVARGVTEDMAALPLSIILASVRADLAAGACVTKLRKAASRQSPTLLSSVPLLTELPLTKPVRNWTNKTLTDLQSAASGRMTAKAALTFATLEGPPGTGKTLIAESLARTAGWNFVPATVGGWFASGDGALGGVAKNIKAFFDLMIASAPAVGLLDELEAVPNRETMDSRGRDWWTPVVNLLLTEIDRLRRSGKPVLLLGATNHYHFLDTALIRPGRLSQRISVQPPSSEDELLELLRYYLKAALSEPELAKLVPLASGATPASVEEWTKEARATARAAGRDLRASDVIGQMLPPDPRSPQDLRAVALHEAGHAIVANRLGVVVERVSTLAEGASGGHTMTRLPTLVPDWNRTCDYVTITLAGRAADIELGTGPNAGAEGDLETATCMLLAALKQQGLGAELIHVAGAMLAADMALVESQLQRLLARAQDIIRKHRAAALRLAEALLAHRVRGTRRKEEKVRCIVAIKEFSVTPD